MTADGDRSWVGSMPAAYDRYLVPTLFAPFGRWIADRLADLGPRDVLEVAAGTGAVTASLVDRLPGARVVATDLNPGMVERGRTRAPGAAWQVADAGSLPFDDGRFDVVVCQFGAMFFPDRPAAYAEARRVLRPGGRLELLVWDVGERNAFADALHASLRELFPADPPTFHSRIPHGYADPGLIARDLGAGGLVDVEVTSVELTGHAATAADVATGYCTGTPLRVELDERGDLGDLTVRMGVAMTARLGEGEVVGRQSAFHATGVRP